MHRVIKLFVEMNPNKKTEENSSKKIKLMDDKVANDFNRKFDAIIDAIDGCSTTNELMLLLNDLPILTLKRNHNKIIRLLVIACQHSGYESFSLRLLELYPRKATLDQDGWENCRNPLHIACIDGRNDIAEQLLEHNSNILLNMPDSHGRTALFYASKLNNVNLVKMLLEEDTIDVNVQDKFGQTALHVSCLHLSYGVIELLINHKNTQLSLKDNGGISAHGTAIRTFFRTVSNTRLAVLEDMEHIFYTLLYSNDEEIECDVTGNTGRVSVIHEHANGGWDYFYAINFLMENGYGYLINQQDRFGSTPLHYACRKTYNDFKFVLDNYMKKFMKIKYLDVNIRDNKGRTPVQVACRNCYTNIVTFLVTNDYNVNINLRDHLGKTALHHAVDGWFNRTAETGDDNSCNNIIRTLMWKNPYLVFHKNDKKLNALEYAKKRDKEEEVSGNDLVQDLWTSAMNLLEDHVHKGRFEMYTYCLNNELTS